ncbi:MAG: MerR family transcriptional regulator [Crocinitomicaceae bacterium]
MAEYSIKDLENFTKIKAHTLRIWEQRYALLSPERTATNIRYYSDKDVKKILNINLLYQNGYKISKIAKMAEKEIFDLAADILKSSDVSERDEINAFIENILELNEGAIVSSLKRMNSEMGMEKLYPDVLIPLLEKVGTLWQVDAISVSHEHFLSNLLREFLITEIAQLPAGKLAKGKVVLFLPEHEKHELSLLFYYYLLKKKKYDCFYLGQSVPMKDLKAFSKEVTPDFLVTSLIAELSKTEFEELFENFEDITDLSNFYIGGYQMIKNKSGRFSKVNIIKGIEDFKAFD